jgi:uncharacterized membrane protein YebE (DUF533 family)
MPDDPREIASAFYYSEQFGFRWPLWKSNPNDVAYMAAALLAVAAGDGELSGPEREWVAGYFAAKGYGAPIMEMVDTAEPSPVDEVVELMEHGSLAFAGRILIYDAIRACSADGDYHEGEEAAIHALGAAMGLTDADVAQIEALIEEEEALKVKRIHLLMPQGHPNLADRYQPAGYDEDDDSFEL